MVGNDGLPYNCLAVFCFRNCADNVLSILIIFILLSYRENPSILLDGVFDLSLYAITDISQQSSYAVTTSLNVTSSASAYNIRMPEMDGFEFLEECVN